MPAPNIGKGQFAIGIISIVQGLEVIDWHTYTAKSILTTYESLASSDSGRTDDGEMHISWILNKIRKFSISMPPLTDAQIADTTYNPLLLVQGQVYYLKVYDVSMTERSTGGRALEIKVYTSNSLAECYSGVIHQGMWQGILFSAIEMKGIKY